jgi:hypothetical protein
MSWIIVQVILRQIICLFTGISGVKLLGVPALPTKSSEKAGNLIARATVNLLEEWDCVDNIGAMVFDTTASNTGQFIYSLIQ